MDEKDFKDQVLTKLDILIDQLSNLLDILTLDFDEEGVDYES